LVGTDKVTIADIQLWSEALDAYLVNEGDEFRMRYPAITWWMSKVESHHAMGALSMAYKFGPMRAMKAKFGFPDPTDKPHEGYAMFLKFFMKESASYPAKYQEYVGKYLTECAQNPEKERERLRIRAEHFAQADVNKDGMLDRKEWRTFIDLD